MRGCRHPHGNHTARPPNRVLTLVPVRTGQETSMEDLLWLAAIAGLTLLTLAYAALCDRA